MSKEENGVAVYRLFLEGNNAAAEELVRMYSDAMIRFAYCYVHDAQTAEDITEDAFVALFVRRRRFSDDDNFRAYLYKTVRNKSLDYIRSNKRFTSLFAAETLPAGDNAETEVLKRERDRALYDCLRSIPKQYGEVLYLSYIEGYKAEEVCKIVKKSKKQVYNLLARGKVALKDELEKEGVVRYENL